MTFPQTPGLIDAWRTSRRSAIYTRGIGWDLTFEQWLQIWEESGHLHERGCRRGQYVMARYGDKGSYVFGNVRIIKVEDNLKEKDASFLKRLNADPEHRAKISAGLMGNKHCLGHKASEETRAKMRKAQQTRRQRENE